MTPGRPGHPGQPPKVRLRSWGDDNVLQVASCLVINESGRILLLQRHRDDLGGGHWGTPGGRQDKGEVLRATARRELREETSIDLAPADETQPLGAHEIRMPHGTVHLHSFLVRVTGEPAVVLDELEHHAHGWFELGRLLDQPDLIWALPTTLRDFGLLSFDGDDPTLADGTTATLLP